MKRHNLLILAHLFLYLPLLASQCDNAAGFKSVEAAVAASGVKVCLSQADFDSGTVRIKKGGLYKLKENINFQPIPALERPDKPQIGWFAAITVETSEGVIIDLNGKTISATQEFVDNHFFNVYAQIELDNCPFSGPLFGSIGSNFTGDTQFVSASNVIVKNGTLARSSHWGVHGNNNSNIHLRKLRIRDFEVAGCEINASQGLTIKGVEVSGLEHVITTRSIFVGALTVQGILAQFAAIPFVGQQLAALTAFIIQNPLFFHAPITMPDGNYYGIRVSSGINITRISFPVTPVDCAILAGTSGGQTARCIEMEDIYIHDLKNAPIESVAIGTQQPTPIDGNYIAITNLGIFGLLRWQDAFDSMGNFAPNTFLQSQVLAALLLEPFVPGALPANFDTIAASLGVTLGGLIPPDYNLFKANAQPFFGINFNAPNVNVGVFAIRHDCSDTVKVKDVKMAHIENHGQPGAELSTIPHGLDFAGLVAETRYIGNDSWGFEYAVVNNLNLSDSRASCVASDNGDVFGIDLANADQNARVCHTETKNMSANGDSQTVVNTPSEVYGVRVANNSGPIIVKDHTSLNTISPRVAFGLATEGTSGVIFKKSTACKTFATSPVPTAQTPAGVSKTAYGFYSSEGSINTLFKKCTEKSSRILGEENVVAQTDSVAAGYAFVDADNGSTVTKSEAFNNHSGGGTANGVRIVDASQNTTVTHNTIIGNFADHPFATGFGILDTAPVSTATIKDNCIKKSSTANISVNK